MYKLEKNKKGVLRREFEQRLAFALLELKQSRLDRLPKGGEKRWPDSTS